MTILDLPPAPAPVELRRYTPPYSTEPSYRRDGNVVGTCETCGWKATAYNGGMLASIMGEHGLATGAEITGRVPVCQAVAA
jgi:hypothetical protein